MELYESVAQAAEGAVLADAIAADYITFTASSTVTSFMTLVGPDERAALLTGPRVVSIGPITSATARTEGLEVHSEATEFTIPGLVAALLADAEATAGR